MNNIATNLDAQVRVACADINGVYIGNPADKTTWGIWFQPTATSAQQTAAHAVITSFVL